MELSNKRLKVAKRVALVILCWVLFLVIDLSKKGIRSDRPDEYYLYYYFSGFLIWIILTFPVLHLFRYSERWQLWQRTILVLILGPFVGSIKAIGSWTIFYAFGNPGGTYSLFLSQLDSFYIIEATITAWVMLIIFFVIELYQKYRDKTIEAAKLESQLATAELQTLKMHIQPHFLFNVHNTIAMMIREGQNDQALDVTLGVSQLLRTTLNTRNDQLVTLGEELDLAKKYLSLEQIRFEDSVSIKIDCPRQLLHHRVPNFFLQPVIENAFKHGVNRNLGDSLLEIECKTENGQLIFSVFNTGPPIPPNWHNAKGIGLNNTLLRLKKLYGNAYSFELDNHDNGVKATIKLPIQ